MKTFKVGMSCLMIILLATHFTFKYKIISSTYMDKAIKSDTFCAYNINKSKPKHLLQIYVEYFSEQFIPILVDQILPYNNSVLFFNLSDFSNRQNYPTNLVSEINNFRDSVYIGTVLGNIYGYETTLTNFLRQDSVFVFSNFSRTIFEVVSYELDVDYSGGKNINFKNQGCVIPNWQKKKLARLKDINRIFIQEVKAKHINGDSFSSEIIRFPTKIYKIVDEKNQ